MPDDDDLTALALDDAQTRMGKAVEALRRELQTIRTGRAHPGLVEHLRVDYFGTEMPLNQLATISAPEARLLVIQPWDKNATGPITKAIQLSDLGLNPQSDGVVIRLAIPELTEERRRELARLVSQKSEAARVAVRNIRRHVQDELRKFAKAKDISQDAERNAHNDLEKLTHRLVEDVDRVGSDKEREMLEV